MRNLEKEERHAKGSPAGQTFGEFRHRSKTVRRPPGDGQIIHDHSGNPAGASRRRPESIGRTNGRDTDPITGAGSSSDMIERRSRNRPTFPEGMAK
ncbi:hypothetical protein BV25DRAFT_1829696 [Artomyces pyxidatus]|uniref:Uncharacterized protein n=1 Tax=Artomyces pyxidatus TaxID=48021 RepID=A0ACB8SQ57_9AGAM|nr:hypothetical protein BV25DRAFT_1829696 [Artomyces pyxidatus]